MCVGKWRGAAGCVAGELLCSYRRCRSATVQEWRLQRFHLHKHVVDPIALIKVESSGINRTQNSVIEGPLALLVRARDAAFLKQHIFVKTYRHHIKQLVSSTPALSVQILFC